MLWYRANPRYKHTMEGASLDGCGGNALSQREKEAGPEQSERLQVSELSDTGRTREENQDHVFSAQLKGGTLLSVCDGMGGHAGGRQASHLAMERLFQVFKKSPRKDTSMRLEDALSEANTAVWKTASRKKALRGMGTTCVALFIDDATNVAHVAHVGDSRCYLSRGSRLQLITRDHTVVQRMLDDGLLTREQAEHHPHSNVIARSLGGDKTVDVDVSAPITLEEGDLFLLCSDGLTGLVAEQEIAELLWSDDLDTTCQTLVDLANANGGTDNITVQLVSYGVRPKRPEHFEFLHPARKPSPEIVAMLDRDYQRHEKETSPVPAVPAVRTVEENSDLEERSETVGLNEPEASDLDLDSVDEDDQAPEEPAEEVESAEQSAESEELEDVEDSADDEELLEEVVPVEPSGPQRLESALASNPDVPPIPAPALSQVFFQAVVVLGLVLIIVYWIWRT